MIPAHLKDFLPSIIINLIKNNVDISEEYVTELVGWVETDLQWVGTLVDNTFHSHSMMSFLFLGWKAI
jgi:hypothetical protein